MVSISSSTEDEAFFADSAAPRVSKDQFNGVEETLAKLAHKAASNTPDPRPGRPESETKSDRPADARISQSSAAPTLGPATLGPATLGPAMLGPATLGAATLGPADVRAQIPREPSRGKRGMLAGVAIAVCLCAAAIWAWRSYGGPAREMIATLTSARSAADQPPVPRMPDPAPAQAAAPPAVEPSPPPVQTASTAPPATTAATEPAPPPVDRQQIDAMARDVAALRQTVEQLAAGQEQLKGEIAKLQAEKSAAEKPPTEKPKKRVVRRVAPADHPSDAFNPALDPNAPGAPRTIGSVVVRGGAPPYSSGVSTLGPVSPPQSPTAPRPPMPVQQP